MLLKGSRDRTLPDPSDRLPKPEHFGDRRPQGIENHDQRCPRR